MKTKKRRFLKRRFLGILKVFQKARRLKKVNIESKLLQNVEKEVFNAIVNEPDVGKKMKLAKENEEYLYSIERRKKVQAEKDYLNMKTLGISIGIGSAIGHIIGYVAYWYGGEIIRLLVGFLRRGKSMQSLVKHLGTCRSGQVIVGLTPI